MANETMPIVAKGSSGEGGKELEDPSQVEQTHPSDWAPAEEQWSTVERAKETTPRRSGRPRSPEPLEAVHMKWPETLLTTVKNEAAKLSLGYQSFIRMAVSEYIRQRREGRA